MQSKAYPIALGGMLAAGAVVLMGIGTILPVATYAAPMLCMMVEQMVLKICGSRIAWAWYGAVALLSALLSADKEAAAVFIFLGYYPIVKPWLDGRKLAWLWKGLLFNGSVALMYFLLLRLLGMGELGEEFAGLGTVMLLVLLAMGNVTFFLLDRLLGMKKLQRKVF